MLKLDVLMKWIVLILFPVIMAKAPVLIMSRSPEYVIEDPPAVATAELKHSLKFKIDTAMLAIHKEGPETNYSVSVWSLSDNCYNCSYYQVDEIQANDVNLTLLVDTRWPVTIKLEVNEFNCSAKVTHHYRERGEYVISFKATDENKANCTISFTTNKEPWNSNLPILVAFCILLFAGLAYTVGCWVYNKRQARRTQEITSFERDSSVSASSRSAVDDLPPPPMDFLQRPRERLNSIDTFRGLCILVMIFVNYKGGYYWFFRHSKWNGLTVADLVFPWFMFIMGVNITLSVNSLVTKNTPKLNIAYKLIRRTLILFALGITVINHNRYRSHDLSIVGRVFQRIFGLLPFTLPLSDPDFSADWQTIRIPGVLQRFAIAYFVAFLLQWCFHVTPVILDARAIKDEDLSRKWWYHIRDVVLYWPQWLVVLALEALWLALTFYLPVPGCPTGYLGPGGLSLDNQTYNGTCIGGAAGYIDRWLLGPDHVYGHPTAKEIYYPLEEDRVPYDPEGVLGSINGCVIVFIGSQMGKIFLYYQHPKDRTVRWLVWGVVLGAISAGLCGASANNGVLPVNKNLWTTTFITTLSSMAFILMIVIYYLVDVRKIWTGAPLNFVGMNSILLYVGHETYSDILPFSWGATSLSTHAEWLAMNMLGVFYWVLIAYYCYKIKFFLKI